MLTSLKQAELILFVLQESKKLLYVQAGLVPD